MTQKKSTEAAFDEIWTSLVQNLEEIFTLNRIDKRTYILMHTNVHDICASNPLATDSETVSLNDSVTELDLSNGRWLYEKLVAYLQSICRRILERLSHFEEVELLEKCLAEWIRYKEAMRLCNDIFSYLNSSWILGISPREGPELVVMNLGHLVWRKNVFCQLCNRIAETILRLISNNRLRSSFNSEMIRSLVEIFVVVNFRECGPADRQAELGLYVECIEGPFMRIMMAHYTSRREDHFKSSFNSVESYIRKVDSFLSFELDFIQQYLHKSSFGKVESIMREILVINMSDAILQQIDDFVANRKYNEIKLIYDLFSNCPDKLNELKLIFEDLVFKYGTKAIQELYQESNDVIPASFFEKVLEIHDRFKEVVQRSFGDFKIFYSYVEKGCVRFVNNIKSLPSHHSPPLILSQHCDNVIKQSLRISNRANIDREFCRMIILLRFIKEKDLFQNYYAKGLARRLIVSAHKKSCLEIEKEFIALLRTECGPDYIYNLSRMLSEAANFENINEQFQKNMSARTESFSHSLNVAVFSSWPFQESYDINLPPEMGRVCDLFEQFHGEKNEGRKISWLHNESYGEVVLNCFRRIYNVSATTYQIVVLMLFNDYLRLSVSEIHKLTIIEFHDLIYTCTSLVQHGLLLAEDSSSTPKDDSSELLMDDLLSLNVNFSSTMYRLNIIIPERVKKDEDNSKMVINIVEDREVLIKAFVVRVMKLQEELLYSDLIEEVINCVSHRFVPDIGMIKEAIESMLEKDYIVRSADNPLLYQYVV